MSRLPEAVLWVAGFVVLLAVLNTVQGLWYAREMRSTPPVCDPNVCEVIQR